MKELNKKNTFSRKLGPRGYKTSMSIWTKKEQELHEDGTPDPLEGCMVHTKNWIQGHSHTDDSKLLATSSSKVTSVAEKIKTLAAKEKIGEFKSQRERDQLRVVLENEEHHGHT
jgi:hypothetical protein